MPANPGVNPSLTITAIAEHAMSKIPPAVPERHEFELRAAEGNAERARHPAGGPGPGRQGPD
jgi:cholesterol oxidase